MEYRFRISEKERELLIDCLKRQILRYIEVTVDDLKEYLKLFIKFITIDRRFRRFYEERINQIIDKLNSYEMEEIKIKKVSYMLYEIIEEYEKEREKIIMKNLNPIEIETYKFILRRRGKVSKIELTDYFFRLCYSYGITGKKVEKAYSIFLRKMKKFKVYPK